MYKIINQTDDLKFDTFFTPTKLDITINADYKLYSNTVKQMLDSSPSATELHHHGKQFR